MKKLFSCAELLCLTMVWALMACNGKSNGSDKKQDTLESTPAQEVRSLNVTIDESALTYEDLTIHLSNGTDYVYRHAPFGTVKVSIDDLPASVDELQNLKLPKGMTTIHQSPYLQPLLIMAALNQLNEDKDEAKRMLDFIVKGVKSENRDGSLVHFPGDDATSAYPSDWSQANQYKNYEKVRSYLEGTTHANNYTPEKPYTMTMTLTNYSYTSDPDYVQLWLTSTQLNNPRELGIWKYDSDNDGEYDTYWSSTFMHLLHSIAEY